MTSDRIKAVNARKAAETRRVQTILERDRADAKAERSRQDADIELSNGLTVNIIDTVVPPTPEWMQRGEVRSVLVGGDKWTDRSAHEPVRTYRRVRTSQAARAHRNFKINDRQYAACVWYSDMFEASGLEGIVRGASFEPRVAGGVSDGVLFTERQIDAQTELRNARLRISAQWQKFFNLVVCHDMSVSAAQRVSQVYINGFNTLRLCADIVADYVELTRGGKELRILD